MSLERSEPGGPASRLSEAAAWFDRLHASDSTAEDFQAFETWIALPGARDAFDRVEAASHDIDQCAPELGAAMDQVDAAIILADQHAALREQGRRRFVLAGVGLAGTMAAAAVGAVVLNVRGHWTTYETAKRATRNVTLADRSVIRLNTNTRLRVRLDRDRRVEIEYGEAAFDVAHNPARPFYVAAGAHEVRVLGTEFNVIHIPDRTAVTVRRGLVQVSDLHGKSQVTQLAAGEEVRFENGRAILATGAVARAFAWQDGRLIYERASLSNLVSDLNRYYAVPIRVEGHAAALEFSGVLTLDRQENVLQRLQAFLPIDAILVDDAIVLRARSPGLHP